MALSASSFATFLIIGPVCFFLGILFISLPYDYNVLWHIPEDRAPYFDIMEQHLKFLYASPPLISRILHIAIGTGLLGFISKLYKPSEANMLFDGASLVLYMVGITVYIANIVKGLRVVSAGVYGAEDGAPVTFEDGNEPAVIGREDSLRVLAASNTILALVLVGVLILQAGQWYAQKKDEAEVEAFNQQASQAVAVEKEHKKVKGSNKKKQ